MSQPGGSQASSSSAGTPRHSKNQTKIAFEKSTSPSLRSGAPDESPKKKQKLSLSKLKNVSSGPRNVTIGELLKLPVASEGTIEKNDTTKTLNAKSVIIRCVITDNRVGRLPRTEKGKEGNRFVYLADMTAFMSIGVDATETKIKQLDLAEEDCVDCARLFFLAEVTGTVSWVPTKRKPDSPTFFLNNGQVKKVEGSGWKGPLSLMYPTGDICRMMAQSAFASSANFHTVAIVGKVDVTAINEDGAVLISLEDCVGYAAVKVSLSTTSTDLSVEELGEQFMAENGIKEGTFMFIQGSLKIGMLDNNALLEVEDNEVQFETLTLDQFGKHVTALLNVDPGFFIGVIPEPM